MPSWTPRTIPVPGQWATMHPGLTGESATIPSCVRGCALACSDDWKRACKMHAPLLRSRQRNFAHFSGFILMHTSLTQVSERGVLF